MKKLTFIFSVLLVLGLVIGAYALSTRSAAKMDCCCKDSCPMKGKASSAAGEHSSCCDETCCKDGSCPMKNKDSAGKEHAAGDCTCCGDSCPMKSKDKAASTAAADSAASGGKKDCCKDKESCPMKKS